MVSTTNNYTLMGFFEVLTLIFVIAKITGYLNWPWLWVFAPVIFHILLVAGIIGIVLIAALIKTAWK